MIKLVNIMLIAVFLIAALVAMGFSIYHMAKKDGERAEQQKQEVVAAQQQEKVVSAKIEIDKTTIDDIKTKMKKFTRD